MAPNTDTTNTPVTDDARRRPGARAHRHARAGVVFALAAGALGLAACGSSSPGASGSSATTTSAPPATVRAASTSSGTVLVDGTGLPLYTYGPDHGGSQSMCTGTCAQAWPPLTVESGTTPTAGSGVSGTLATAKQANGTEQVTYDGGLLYRFASDSPGKVTGNGVGGFSVVKVSSSASNTSSGSGSGGGSGQTPPTTSGSGSGGGSQY